MSKRIIRTKYKTYELAPDQHGVPAEEFFYRRRFASCRSKVVAQRCIRRPGSRHADARKNVAQQNRKASIFHNRLLETARK